MLSAIKELKFHIGPKFYKSTYVFPITLKEKENVHEVEQLTMQAIIICE